MTISTVKDNDRAEIVIRGTRRPRNNEARFTKRLSIKSLDPMGYFATPDHCAGECVSGATQRADVENLMTLSVKHLQQYLEINECETLNALRAAYNDLAQNRFLRAWQRLMELRELPGSPWFVFRRFADYLHFCNDFVVRQKAAVEKGIPPLYFISFPKTASSFVASVFAQALDISACTTSLLHSIVGGAWLRCFLRGGAVTHEHTFPFRKNVRLLHDHSARVFVHVRNPKQVIVSHAHHYMKPLKRMRKEQLTTTQEWFLRASLTERIDFLIDDLIPYYGKWIKGWHRAWAQNGIHITFTSYEQFVGHEDEFFQRIAASAILPGDALNLVRLTWRRLDTEGTSYNMRNKTADEWVEVLTRKQQQRIDELIPPEFAEVDQQSRV